MQPAPSGSQKQKINDCLDRVTASAGFIRSSRICRLLRHCVEWTLEGRQDQLKEILIGMQVFDRGPKFDPRTDTIVRVDARRLRQKLEIYYRNEGRNEPIEIVFSPGSYVPSFRDRLDAAREMECGPETVVSSIVVLPFWNIGDDPELEYFCDGLTEELIATLARLKGIRVVARTSAFQFKGKPHDIREIGSRLNVQTVLEGSVRKSGSHMRVTAQLIESAQGCHLWSESFDRELNLSFALQDDIARGICARLRETLPEGTARKPRNRRAFDLYLKGRYLWNQRHPDSLRCALTCFEQAVAADPDYPQPYSGISDCYTMLGVFGFRPSDVMPKAEAAARKAIELDGAAAEAYASLGAAMIGYRRDHKAGEEAFRRAVELQPGSSEMYEWYSFYLACMGRCDEAVDMIRLAHELDPLSPYVNSNVGVMLYLARRYRESINHFQSALASDPLYYWTHWHLGMTCLAIPRYEKAIAAFARAADLSNRNAPVLGCLAMAYGMSNDRPAAERIVAELLERRAVEYVCPAAFAVAYAGLGDHDRAFDWLHCMVQERSSLYLWFTWPLLDSLRQDPRMAGLLEAVGMLEQAGVQRRAFAT